MRLAKIVRIGTTIIPAITLGITKKRMGLIPAVVSASTSLLTVIVPISAANAADERPANNIAVINGPNSRKIPLETNGAT